MSTIKPLVYDAANARLAEQAVVIPPGYIDGLNLVWNSGTSISVTSGSAYIEGASAVVNVPSALTLSGLSLTASTWYHVYLYLNAGVPAIECVTAAPATAYSGTARSKTGDTYRRYIGSVRTGGSGNIYNFLQIGIKVMYRAGNGVSPFRIVSNSTSTTQTSASASAIVPATARQVSCQLINLSNSGSGVQLCTGTSDGSQPGPPLGGIYIVREQSTLIAEHPLDSSQALTYWLSAVPASGGAYIDVYGYSYER